MIISIVIPTYNRAGTLSNAVQSVIGQSENMWELIIIDDGSTDDTEKLVEKYLKDDRVVYFKQDNQGVSAARNKGAELAKGDYLIFLDSDDSFHKHLLKHLLDAKFFKYDVIFWNVLKKTNGRLTILKPRNLGKLYNHTKAIFLAGSVCYKKEIFIKAEGYDTSMSFGENYELGIRISNLENLKFKYINFPLLNYFIETKNRISNAWNNRIASHLHQYKKHKEKFLSDRKAGCQMQYIIGFTFEQNNQKQEAIFWYKKAWKSDPLAIKSILKLLYLKIFK